MIVFVNNSVVVFLFANKFGHPTLATFEPFRSVHSFKVHLFYVLAFLIFSHLHLLNTVCVNDKWSFELLKRTLICDGNNLGTKIAKELWWKNCVKWNKSWISRLSPFNWMIAKEENEKLICNLIPEMILLKSFHFFWVKFLTISIRIFDKLFMDAVTCFHLFIPN